MTKTDELEARIQRLEDLAVLLCEHASRGQGSMGKPFWEFADAIRRERVGQEALDAVFGNAKVG